MIRSSYDESILFSASPRFSLTSQKGENDYSGVADACLLWLISLSESFRVRFDTVRENGMWRRCINFATGATVQSPARDFVFRTLLFFDFIPGDVKNDLWVQYSIPFSIWLIPKLFQWMAWPRRNCWQILANLPSYIVFPLCTRDSDVGVLTIAVKKIRE